MLRIVQEVTVIKSYVITHKKCCIFYVRVEAGESNDLGMPECEKVPKPKVNTTSGVFLETFPKLFNIRKKYVTFI